MDRVLMEGVFTERPLIDEVLTDAYVRGTNVKSMHGWRIYV